MGDKTGIQWTDATVNFWWGCTKVGPGCDHCYAETWSKRTGEAIWGIGAPRRKIKGAPALIHKLDNDYSQWSADHAGGFLPEHCGPRRRVFIQSMSDIFDLEVPDAWFIEAWALIASCSRIDTQIVTKRVSAIEKRLGGLSWPKHAGLIVTVVNQPEADRDITRLLALKAKLGIPWVGLSIEPMLGEMDIAWALSRNRLDIGAGFLSRGQFSPGLETLSGLDWVIVGGESGTGARPMHPDWARAIRDQCKAAGVPFFFKQWGAWAPSSLGPEIARLSSEERVLRDDRWCGSWISDSQADEPDTMNLVGKKAAGRLLDGAEHNEMPR